MVLIAIAACALAAAVAHRRAARRCNPVPEIHGLPQAARNAAASIDPEKIRAHVRFLSLDLLEGRGPGTRGGELAAEYIATQFALAGVSPRATTALISRAFRYVAVHTIEDKTKFSFVPAQRRRRSISPMAPKSSPKIRPASRRRISMRPSSLSATAFTRLNTLGRLRGSNGKEIDLKGKIALVIVNEPPSDDEKFFKGNALTYYGRWTYKYEEAARRGAVGVLIIHRTDLASYGWEVVRNSQAVEKSYLQGDPDATLARRRMDSARCCAAPVHACRPGRPGPGD